MIDIGEIGRKALVQAADERDLYLEGNIIKLIDPSGDPKFTQYLEIASNRDKESRRRRLDITKQIQTKNALLETSEEENKQLVNDLQEALAKAKTAKESAQNDLDHLQKKTQFELMGNIVKVALAVILGVGIITTLLYMTAIITGKETALIGTAWSSMFGILLTNSFSIIGTIMGVKYASDKSS
jgi:Fe2+ transport system protein B